MAVAVIVHRIVEIMRRQKLRLPEFAGPGADHLGSRKIAAVDDFQRGDGFLLEHLRAPAVICQRHQRRQRMKIAELGAKAALQPPERGDYGRRHAIFLFGAVERGRMNPDPRLRIFGSPVGGPVAREIGEHRAERALAAVAVDDALVVDEVGRRFGHRTRRYAGCDRLLLEIGEEAVERHAVVTGSRTRAGCRHRRLARDGYGGRPLGRGADRRRPNGRRSRLGQGQR